MRGSSGLLLLLLGLFVLYLGTSKRYPCLQSFTMCLAGKDAKCNCAGLPKDVGTLPDVPGLSLPTSFSLPALPALPKIGYASVTI